MNLKMFLNNGYMARDVQRFATYIRDLEGQLHSQHILAVNSSEFDKEVVQALVSVATKN